MDWAGAPWGPVALGNADVGAAAVVPGARVGRCGDTKRERVGLWLSPQDCSLEGAGNQGEARTHKNGCSCGLHIAPLSSQGSLHCQSLTV